MRGFLAFFLLIGLVCGWRHGDQPWRHSNRPGNGDIPFKPSRNPAAGTSVGFSTVPASTSLNAVSIDPSATPPPPPLETETSYSMPFSSAIAADERSSTASLENKQATASAPSGTPAVFLAEPTASDPVLAPASFKHPGLLHTDDDFARIRAKVNAGKEPWNTAWNKMLQSSYASSSYQPSPAEVVYRGSDGTHAENYGQLYRDVAAAYVLAVRWAISQDAEYGNAAVRIMDAWSSNLTTVSGNVDLYLAVGIYGYEFAQAGEIMRNFEGWSAEGFQKFKTMMTTAFYKPIHGWFEGHADWASYGRGVYPNWDLCLIAAAMSIGVLADDSAIYNQGISWFYNGTGNGQINEAVPYTFWYDNQVLGQTMESGRDQGHNTLNIALLGVIAQIAYNQGNDLFSYNGSIILAASEYVARYNLGFDVPYNPYDNGWINLPTISNSSRGSLRPNWELLYNHYGILKGQNATWTKRFRDLVVSDNGGAEGGSGDYGPNSGGYDQLGWGTLLYSLEE